MSYDMDRDDDFDGLDGLDGDGGRRRRGGKRKLANLAPGEEIVFDYKAPQQLRFFLTERGKIVPRRISGLTAKQQRELALAVRRARNIALLPYTVVK